LKNNNINPHLDNNTALNNDDFVDVLHTAFFPIENHQPNKQDSFNLLTKQKRFELNRNTSAPIQAHINEHLEGLVRNVSNIIIKNREKSAQEAAYIICSLPLRDSSLATFFVNTKPA
jgi:hypothetical protein